MVSTDDAALVAYVNGCFAIRGNCALTVPTSISFQLHQNVISSYVACLRQNLNIKHPGCCYIL